VLSGGTTKKMTALAPDSIEIKTVEESVCLI